MGHGLLSVRRGGGFSALLRSGGVFRCPVLLFFLTGRGGFSFLFVLVFWLVLLKNPRATEQGENSVVGLVFGKKKKNRYQIP